MILITINQLNKFLFFLAFKEQNCRQFFLKNRFILVCILFGEIQRKRKEKNQERKKGGAGGSRPAGALLMSLVWGSFWVAF